MTKEELFAQVPNYDKIIPNGVTKVDSIFEFEDTKTLFAFLRVCHDKKSTVEFLNEGLVYEWTDDDPFYNLKLALYMGLKENPKVVEGYVRWLFSKEQKRKDRS